ncbi:uncharacterized protein LOC133440720 [Cololabis saira]|uniref:uncharacterized protein LOC133440720 n=1 Tax=Cololabis saira TaxID=129043 RepID=UPI002AD3B72E|nr:uncharacterized protein LOC133440720 [Cololabis saira]
MLKKHKMIHKGEKLYICKTCGKNYTQRSTLVIHSRTHTGERPYPCNTCSKTFTNLWDLRRHITTHTGEKPYICKTCGKSYRQDSHLLVHSRIHTGERRYLCNIGGKSFINSSHLKRHITTHTGEKPYICKTCGKSYTERYNLVVHSRTHSGERPYLCNTCSKTDRPEILGRWANHFETLLNHANPVDLHILDGLPDLPPVEHLDSPPQFCETRQAIRDLKNNKSAGPDGIPAEVFKNGKVLAKIMFKRLEHISEAALPETQCGFRKSRSTTDMVFVLRQLLEKSREQCKDLYIAFIDLSKAFDTINREMLWKQLDKLGVPPKFLSVLQQLHTGMQARVITGDLQSEPFKVNTGVKQGCVLAPVLFNLLLSAITFLFNRALDHKDGVHLEYRLDGNLFNIRRLKAHTKTKICRICELQYADDCAVLAHSPESMQHALNTISTLYQSFGLQVNTQKTEIMSQLVTQPPSPHSFHINGIPLKTVEHFTYLGSTISSHCSLDTDVHTRINKASSAFGRLRRRVFENRNLKVGTKVAVYNAVCVSTLLYGAETWTPYRRHITNLEAFHIRCLQKILGLSWEDKVPHSEILKSTNSSCMEAAVAKRHLRWIGHTIRLPEHRLPRQVLYGQLQDAKRAAGGQKKRYKDYTKDLLKRIAISPTQLETLACDRLGEKRYLCKTCNKGFSRRSILLNHMKIHTGERPYLCNTCNKTFTRSSDLKRHITMHTGEKPYICKTCGKSYKLRFHLVVHSRTHTGEKPYLCNTCGKTFTQSSNLKSHITMHTGEKPYICKTCGKSYRQRSTLVVHSRTHTGEKPYLCNTCGKTFTESSTLKRHITTHTGKSKLTKTHTGKKVFSCSTCKKEFSRSSILIDHMKIHTGERPYLCNTCGKSFTKLSNLKRHITSHTGEKPYICKTCGKSYTERSSLLVHSRTHTGERPYLCNTCGKTFTDSSALKRHITTHTGEKPYICKTCGKSYKEHSSLLVHSRIHTGKRPYHCNTCGKTFTKSSHVSTEEMPPEDSGVTKSSSTIEDLEQKKIKMRLLTEDDALRCKEVDAKIKNRWCWKWMEEIVTSKINDVEKPYALSECVKKIDEPGRAMCEWCRDVINYGPRGKVALVEHTKTKKHLNHLTTRSTNYSLGSIAPQTSKKVFPIFGLCRPKAHEASTSETPQPEPVKPIVPISDRTANLEALVLGTLAEHSLPFTTADIIVRVAKELAKDPKALENVHLEASTASYKMRFGLQKTFTEKTVEAIQSSPFSLNLDEATTASNKKVVTFLVSYFSQEQQEVVVEHLDTVELKRTTSQSLFDALGDVFERMNIPWRNLVSVLMDSCSVMRGSKNGLEAKIREKIPHLLNIDGDSCHHIHNCAKEFCKPFGMWLEVFFNDLHTDFKWTPEFKDCLREIAAMFNQTFTAPERFIPHRWLSAYDVALSTARLLKPMQVFYYSFLKPDDKELYEEPMEAILNHNEICPIDRNRIREIQRRLASKTGMTENGKNRKKRIVKCLFFKQKKTVLQLNLYLSVLPLLKEYVMVFQTQSPMIHKLHDRQQAVFRKFLACYVRPEKFASLHGRELKEMDISTDKGQFLPTNKVFVNETIVRASSDVISEEFLHQMATAYKMCGKKMQEKLPLHNKVLRTFSATDPECCPSTAVITCLKHLCSCLKDVSPSQYEAACQQCHHFVADKDLPAFAADDRADIWWGLVTKKYPDLGHFVLAAYTCFRGPQVESSFSSMKGIMNERTGQMNVKTLSAYQTGRYGLKAHKASAISMFGRKNILHEPIPVQLCRNIRSAAAAYRAEKEEKRQTSQAQTTILLTKAKARELREKAMKTRDKITEALCVKLSVSQDHPVQMLSVH